MNDKAKLQPDEHLDQAWNEDLNKTDALQRWLYNTNQFFVNDGIKFHDNVQQDMGLSPGGVWYPTYEMADGEVPLTPPGCEKACPMGDPAKEESEVSYSAPAPAPAPASGSIDYKMLQRSIKSE